MPRLSVYVSDDLWSEARLALPGRNPSQTVQEALRSFVEGHRGLVGSFQPHGDTERLIESAARRIANEATGLFADGYRSAADAVQVLGLGVRQVNDIAADSWYAPAWAHKVTDADVIAELLSDSPAESAPGKLLVAMGYRVDPGSYQFEETPFFTDGAIECLRRIWREATGLEGPTGTRYGSPPPELPDTDREPASGNDSQESAE